MGQSAGDLPQTHVTRDVEVSAVRDLLERPPRGTVAFVDGGAVSVVPARAVHRADTHLFGVLVDAAPDLDGREVVLLIDAGPYWFQLRGISVRGVAARAEPPAGNEGSNRLVWYAIQPRRVLAWDYGTIHEE